MWCTDTLLLPGESVFLSSFVLDVQLRNEWRLFDLRNAGENTRKLQRYFYFILFSPLPPFESLPPGPPKERGRGGGRGGVRGRLIFMFGALLLSVVAPKPPY